MSVQGATGEPWRLLVRWERELVQHVASGDRVGPANERCSPRGGRETKVGTSPSDGELETDQRPLVGGRTGGGGVDGRVYGKRPMSIRNPETGNLAADAAYASAERTIGAIEDAARKNDDPEVAAILEEAAVNADTTANRVGWLRQVFRRAFGTRASVNP